MGFFHCNYYHYRNSFLTHSSLFESALDSSWHHSNTFWYLLCNLTLKDVPSLLYTFPGSELEVAISPRSLGYKNWFFERTNEINKTASRLIKEKSNKYTYVHVHEKTKRQHTCDYNEDFRTDYWMLWYKYMLEGYLEENANFLGKWSLPKPSSKRIGKWSRPISQEKLNYQRLSLKAPILVYFSVEFSQTSK